MCCSSPERFLRGGRGRTLEAKPIKGTARRSADPGEDAALAAALQVAPAYLRDAPACAPATCRTSLAVRRTGSAGGHSHLRDPVVPGGNLCGRWSRCLGQSGV